MYDSLDPMAIHVTYVASVASVLKIYKQNCWQYQYALHFPKGITSTQIVAISSDIEASALTSKSFPGPQP